MKKEKRAAFIEQNPFCCYCNGKRPTVEVDHAPARICFIKKVGPEGFEFPSCSKCNRIAGLSELVMAFYIRSFDRSAIDLDEEEFSKLAKTIKNNAPGSIPQFPAKASLGPGLSILPSYEMDRITTIPPEAKAHIKFFLHKTLYALYYKVTGKFAGSKNRYSIEWAQAKTDAAELMLITADKWFAEHEVGARSNVDLGNQFTYQTGYNPSHEFFGVRMSFAGAFVAFAVIGPARKMAEIKKRDPICPSIYDAGLFMKKQQK